MYSLRPFQREDVENIKRHNLRALVASAPGVGKTIIAIRAVVEARKLPALVVCPASVIFNWERELKRWAPGVSVTLIEDGMTDIPKGSAFYITSWSLLNTRLHDILVLQFQTIIGDEAHFSKSPDSIRSQAFAAITSASKHVLLLTGTPIINHQGELEILRQLLGENPLMIRRLLEEVALDIPPKTRSYLNIQLRKKHQTIYDKANNDFETWLREEKAKLSKIGLIEADIERTLAAEALAKIGYLRRLVGEFKVPAALDWIVRAVRLGETVVVFVEHQATLNALKKGLRRQRVRHGIIEGATTTRNRQAIIDGFQGRKFPVFIGTKAAKEGITLTSARHVLFVERFFTSAEEEQAEDRARRIGQKYPTTMWYLHAVDTVDDRIDDIVRSKRRIIREAIGSATISETPSSNVTAILQSWDTYAREERQVVKLGQGDPLPPLPLPRETHAIIFHGKRWTTKAALVWCRMNGYRPERRVELVDRFKLITHPPTTFQPHKFKLVKVCADVRIIVGTRLNWANEQRARRLLDNEFRDSDRIPR